MLIYIDRALSENTNHVGSHLLLAEHLIDGEEYSAARKILDTVHKVNPWHPKSLGVSGCPGTSGKRRQK